MIIRIFQDLDPGTFYFIFFRFLFIFRDREKKGSRKRGRETSVCGCVSCAPHWGPDLQPEHVPWLEIELMTLRFAGLHSIHWATPARAGSSNFLKRRLGQEEGNGLSGRELRFIFYFGVWLTWSIWRQFRMPRLNIWCGSLTLLETLEVMLIQIPHLMDNGIEDFDIFFIFKLCQFSKYMCSTWGHGWRNWMDDGTKEVQKMCQA